MFSEAGLGRTWADKIIWGSEEPLLGLSLLHLPRLRSIKPAYFYNMFMNMLAPGTYNQREALGCQSPLMSSLEPLSVGARDTDAPDAYSSSGGSAAIFINSGSSYVLPSPMCRRPTPNPRPRPKIHSVGFDDFHSTPEELGRAMTQFHTVREIKVSCRRQNAPSNLKAVCDVFQKSLGPSLTCLKLTTTYESPETCIDSLVSFSVLRNLRLDLHMLISPKFQHTISFTDLLPPSVQTLSIIKIPAEKPCATTIQHLLLGSEIRSFPQLASIFLELDTCDETILPTRTQDVVEGLRLSCIVFNGPICIQDCVSKPYRQATEGVVNLSLALLPNEMSFSSRLRSQMELPREELVERKYVGMTGLILKVYVIEDGDVTCHEKNIWFNHMYI